MYNSEAIRPKKWAQPLELKGVNNFFRINANLYRSAQPTEEGFQNLNQLGIKTILNLRAYHSDRKKIGKVPLNYEHIFMRAWIPRKSDVIKYLKILKDPNNQPILIHCQHGADRTGTMCAIYRLVCQNWSIEEALDEMQKGGYGFHRIWKNLPKWIANLDLKNLKKSAGVVG